LPSLKVGLLTLINMAVLERTYKRYEGVLSPEWSRFLIIPRHAFRHVFRSKLFTGFYVLSFVVPLVFAILIYLRHNAEALAILNLNIVNVLPIDATFFQTFVMVQGQVGFILALLVGPQQVSRDLTNNALPLYLSRPFSRTEYVVGKMSIVILLLSTITWVPGLILFLLQSYLEGWSWFTGNISIASAIFLGSLVWILLLALLTQTISAWVKWRIAASAGLIGLFFIPSVFATIVNQLLETHWGNILSLSASIQNIWAGLFGTFVRQATEVQGMRNRRVIRTALMTEPPLWASWMMLFLICALCLLLLSRKVKAYEVVK
jgi:ABC-2 type transport system permease protein